MANIGLDIVKLYAQSSTEKWNNFLTKCVDNLDINAIAKTRRELQIGMNDLVKKKLSSEKLNVFFLRLNKSLENTARQIIRIKNPFPNDDPRSKHKNRLDCKRQRDKELNDFLKRSSF